MILSGEQIRHEVAASRIVIDPFLASRVNPNSYNYRLGESYIELSADEVFDVAVPCAARKPRALPASGLVLMPSRLYLCNTAEVIGSDHYVTSLIGKSSMGRLGLFLQISADLGHQSRIHRWTLELRCSKPIRVYPGMIIGQVTFWMPLGEPLLSRGYYSHHDAPTPSKACR